MLRRLIVAALARRSPGEAHAMQLYLRERDIAARHRAGLRALHTRGLLRPTQLNLGSGPHPKPGFLNVDIDPRADVTLDLRHGLPFESGCCTRIFSEHCLEHLEYPEPAGRLLRDCRRVLHHDGELLLSVPDTAWPLQDYRDGPDAPYFAACRAERWHPAECTTRVEHINYHFRQGDEHRFAYDFETLAKALAAAGFTHVTRREADPSLDSTHRVTGSLLVRAAMTPPRAAPAGDALA